MAIIHPDYGQALRLMSHDASIWDAVFVPYRSLTFEDRLGNQRRQPKSGNTEVIASARRLAEGALGARMTKWQQLTHRPLPNPRDAIFCF